MQALKPLLVSAVIVTGMATLSLWAAPALHGATVATHWGVSGRPDGFMPAAEALPFGPAVALVLALGFAAAPMFMPASGRLERSWSVYVVAWLSTVALLAVAHAGIVFHALDRGWPVPRVVSGAMGAMLIVLGDLLPKVRYNYVLGVRTPWTLDSEAVWDRTHRAMGPVVMLWGMTVLAAALFMPSDHLALLHPVVLAGALLVTVMALGYSYWASRTA